MIWSASLQQRGAGGKGSERRMLTLAWAPQYWQDAMSRRDLAAPSPAAKLHAIKGTAGEVLRQQDRLPECARRQARRHGKAAAAGRGATPPTQRPQRPPRLNCMPRHLMASLRSAWLAVRTASQSTESSRLVQPPSAAAPPSAASSASPSAGLPPLPAAPAMSCRRRRTGKREASSMYARLDRWSATFYRHGVRWGARRGSGLPWRSSVGGLLNAKALERRF